MRTGVSLKRIATGMIRLFVPPMAMRFAYTPPEMFKLLNRRPCAISLTLGNAPRRLALGHSPYAEPCVETTAHASMAFVPTQDPAHGLLDN